jgi:hypothetical protein
MDGWVRREGSTSIDFHSTIGHFVVSHIIDLALCAWCRDRELKRQEAEEEKKRKDMQRRENERKDKLLAEAKVRGFIYLNN